MCSVERARKAETEYLDGDAVLVVAVVLEDEGLVEEDEGLVVEEREEEAT